MKWAMQAFDTRVVPPGIGFDPATPSDHAEALDHGRVAVGADQGVE